MRAELLEWVADLRTQMDECVHYQEKADCQHDIDRITAILAAHPGSAVSLKPGWICKDSHGLSWFQATPVWYTMSQAWGSGDHISSKEWSAANLIVDPWPSMPRGGPSCLIEVHATANPNPIEEKR